MLTEGGRNGYDPDAENFRLSNKQNGSSHEPYAAITQEFPGFVGRNAP